NAAISSRQVELAIGRLECLSTLPCVASLYIPKLTKSQFQPSVISDIIESDPALTVSILSLLSGRGMSTLDRRFSIANAIDKLPANEVRDALLSLKVSTIENNPELSPDRKGLLKHNLSVACYAKAIADYSTPQMDTQLAYFAGLLHDIGKSALIETMPRSFFRITEQAKNEKTSCRSIEQKHMGLDHTLIGKRLAEKWQLPDLITLSIWLHHSMTETILHDMPEARIAAVIQLADYLARQSGIGNSGSYDFLEPSETWMIELNIDSEQLKQIHHRVREEVTKKIAFLGIDAPDSIQKYIESVQTAMVQYSQRDSEISSEFRHLQTVSGHFNFVRDFLLSINSGVSAIDIAENFATRWQKFYQTGRVCLYLLPQSGSQTLEAVVVGGLSQSEVALLNTPTEDPVIPKIIADKFAIIDANDDFTWLFEQLETDFDIRRTKIAPLMFGAKAVGVIVFELNYPSDIGLFEEQFKTSAKIAGFVLAAALNKNKEMHFSERFAKIINLMAQEKYSVLDRVESTEKADSMFDYSLAALAELAAGAAHELNNPLAVIAGRAQLLAESEQNQGKKQILQQIQENANEASEIIEDLMSFAEPPSPRPSRTDISQVIEEALQLASRKAKTEKINAEIEIAENITSLFIDSAQIVSAIANIICNAIESYGQIDGLVKVSIQLADSEDFVKMSIEDQGCGMSSETLKKATQPFFSAKPAGRKRGMGLAYAARLIQLNKGSLSIASETGKGTTVSIYLPNK
ncbi:MAG: HDOD domain-containing protein, partial [Sedimentisphaerales bacterium]|nr:HDOD domain-containing protein [Sedimentisphaerales bacterium]